MEIDDAKYLPIEHVHLTDWMKVRALKELGETKETKLRCLEEIRSKVAALDDIRMPMDDIYLLQFLRYRKYCVDNAFRSIVKMFTAKKKCAEICHTSNTLAYLGTYSSYILNIMPHRDKDGSMIRIMHVEKWNVDEYSLEDIFHGIMMELMCALASDEATQVCRVKLILDMKGTSVSKLRQFTLSYMILASRALSDLIPVRVRVIHVCHEPAIFSYVWAIMRPILSKKLRERVFFHSKEIQGLHQFFDKSLLPEELGGYYKYNSSCMKRIEKFLRERYEDELNIGYVN